MDYNEITADEIKQHLEDEVAFIYDRVDDEEIKETLERIRISYFHLYNIAKDK